MVRLPPLRPYRVRDAPEETLRRRQGDIRVRQRPNCPSVLIAETQVFWRKSSKSITYKLMH